MKKLLEEISLSKGEYGGGFSAVDFDDSKPRYVRITDITDEGGLNQDRKSPSGNNKDWVKYYLQEGDLLFARSGATVGKSFLFNSKYGDCIYAGYLIRFRINKELADPKYVYYFTKTISYKSWIANKQNVVAQPNINAKQYGQELEIPLPLLATQKKIAAILDAADAYRQKTKALIGKYDELTQSLFLEMFGDPVTNPKGWEKVELNKLCLFQKESIKPEEIAEGMAYIALDSIEKETGKIVEVYMPKSDEIKSNKFKFDSSSILYGKLRPYLNKVALPDFEGICSTHIIPIKPIVSQTNRHYISHLLRGKWFVDFASEKVSGANLPRISPSAVASYKAIKPPHELQNQFAERVLEIEGQKSKAQESLVRAEELFNSMLQKAFKGEVV